jgi:hypothetical protein
VFVAECTNQVIGVAVLRQEEVKVKTRALFVPHGNSLKKDYVIGTLTDS